MGEDNLKSGFVTVTGRVNVGKSTLINNLIQEKVSITSTVPQTTRQNVKGILDQPDCQMVFVDGPGHYKPKNELGEHLLERARSNWGEGDVILFVYDAFDGWGSGDEYLAEELKHLNKPVVLVPNKIDKFNDEVSIPQPEGPDPNNWKDCVPTSATRRENFSKLISTIKNKLPEGPRFYPGESTTDRNRTFLISEAIREKAMKATREEVPHSIASIVESIHPGDNPEVTVIEATIYVERPSQKGILIGQGGKSINRIGQNARAELTKYFDEKIYLDLTVDVLESWSNNRKAIRRIERRKSGRMPT